MFWRLERHAKTTANTRMQPKNPSLLIYEVLIDNTLNRAAMFFFFGHPYLVTCTVYIYIYNTGSYATIITFILYVDICIIRVHTQLL